MGLVAFRVKPYVLFLYSQPTSLQLVIGRLFMLTASNRLAKACGISLLVYSATLFYLPFPMWVRACFLMSEKTTKTHSGSWYRLNPIKSTTFHCSYNLISCLFLPTVHYLLSLGSHDVQLVHLWFQGLILDPQVLLCSCITHFHQIVLNLSQVDGKGYTILGKTFTAS